MRSGGDDRGGSPDRRRRAQRLLDIYGDSETCICVHCGCLLTSTARLPDHPFAERLEQDRIDPEGGYVIANLQPACGLCNKKRSNRPERFALERHALKAALAA